MVDRDKWTSEGFSVLYLSQFRLQMHGFASLSLLFHCLTIVDPAAMRHVCLGFSQAAAATIIELQGIDDQGAAATIPNPGGIEVSFVPRTTSNLHVFG